MKIPKGYKDPHGLSIKDRNPTPEDAYDNDQPICLGDMWFNKKDYEMFMLVGIRDGKREWKDIISLREKLEKDKNDQ